MKLKYYLSAVAMFFVVTACEDQLNINENPNQSTDADVELVLPAAITSSAFVANQFNSYGAHFGGYMANAGGFSGFGNLLNYNLTPGDWNAMWVSAYQDPLADLRYVIEETEGNAEYAYFNAAAKIMSVVNYQRLVDAFGNIPYSEALRAEEGLVAPKYDDAATIYQDLYATLDEAIDIIEAAEANTEISIKSLTRATDPLFGSLSSSSERKIEEQMADWKRFANTLKLRMLLRLSEKAEFNAFVTTGFAELSTEFLTDDAIVDPGFELNRPNPAWNSWGKTPAGALANTSRVPTTYSFEFYNGGKILDIGRGETIFVNFKEAASVTPTPHNQLGNEDDAPTIISGLVTWASNDEDYGGLGVLKGPAMGQPLMLKAEALFLVAEAQLRGFIPGDDEESFYDGIEASFVYLYKDEAEALKDTTDMHLLANYIADNETNRLVVYDLNASDIQKKEAIITQKYIALNMVNSDEGYNEFRRTGFPATVPSGGPILDIASNKSNVTSRPDRLPTRVLYPSTEQSYNAANYRAVDYTSELIFWDPN